MKTTIEIADDLFERTQRLAQKEKTTFRALTERGLRMVLARKQHKGAKVKWKPVTFGGSGLREEFKDWNWEKVRDAAYEGHGS